MTPQRGPTFACCRGQVVNARVHFGRQLLTAEREQLFDVRKVLGSAGVELQKSKVRRANHWNRRPIDDEVLRSLDSFPLPDPAANHDIDDLIALVADADHSAQRVVGIAPSDIDRGNRLEDRPDRSREHASVRGQDVHVESGAIHSMKGKRRPADDGELDSLLIESQGHLSQESHGELT
jgi:hypothetical protein